MAQIDITQTNKAVREQIEVTENPRHRDLLQAYGRHRNLEHAGRVEEIFDPADVLTTNRAAELLDPLIKPLPRFDDSALPTAQRATR